MEPIHVYVNQKVWELRLAKGMSKQEFGDNINLSQAFIRGCESPLKNSKYNIRYLFRSGLPLSHRYQ